jgi:hypothetical protein
MAVAPQPVYSKLRRWPRYKLNLPVRVVAQRGDKVVIVPGRGNELNEGGLAVFVGMELAADEQIALEFTPPYAGIPIRARCTVCDRNGYTYGLEFVCETEQDLENSLQISNVLRGMGSLVK